MKKCKILAFWFVSVILIISAVLPSFAAESLAPRYEYTLDISNMSVYWYGSLGSQDLSDGVATFSGQYYCLSLGNIDLSSFNSLEIELGHTADLSNEDVYVFLRKYERGTIYFWDPDSDSSILTYDSIYPNGKESSVMKLSLEDIDYAGPIHLAFWIPNGNTIDVKDVTFVAPSRMYTQADLEGILEMGSFHNSQITAQVTYNTTNVNNYNVSPDTFKRGFYFQTFMEQLYDEYVSDIIDGVCLTIDLDVPLANGVTSIILNKPAIDSSVGLAYTVNYLDSAGNRRYTQMIDYGSDGGYYQVFYDTNNLANASLPNHFFIEQIVIDIKPTSSVSSQNQNDAFYEFMVTDPFHVIDVTVSSDGNYNVIYNQGKDAGYNQAVGDLRGSVFNEGYDVGYSDGSKDGYSEAKDYYQGIIVSKQQESYDDGYKKGDNAGYTRGYNAGLTTSGHSADIKLKNLIFWTFDAISSFITNFISFDFLGINLLSLFTSIFSITVFMFFLRWFMKLLGKL